MNKYISLLLFIGLAWGQFFDSKGISFGIGDTETGISLIGFNLSKNMKTYLILLFSAFLFFLKYNFPIIFIYNKNINVFDLVVLIRHVN